MKHVFLPLALVVLPLAAAAQTPPVQWQRSLGGSLAEELFDIQPTADGGSVMVGYATSTDGDVSDAIGNEDLWVVKLDAIGTLQWERSFGGSDSDMGRSIEQTPDGGYIVSGTTRSSDGDVTLYQGDGDLWVLRLDATGDLLWQRTLGGPFRESGGYVAASASGDVYVTGSSKSATGDLTANNGDFDIWIVKLDPTGNLLWQHNYGGSAEDWVTGVCSTTDGGVIVSGYTASTNGLLGTNQGLTDAWLIKLTNTGLLDWQRTYGGGYFDAANAVQQTADGGYIMAGNAYSSDGDLLVNNGGWDMWVQKLDPTGAIQWHTSVGGSSLDLALSIAQTTDGDYLAAGHSTSSNGGFPTNQGDEDSWLIRLDPAGTVLWKRSFGGSGYDWAAAAHPTADGGYLLGGTTFSTDGDVLANNGFLDYYVVKFGAGPTTGIPTAATDHPFHLWPNPAQDHLVIDLDPSGPAPLQVRLYDQLGQELTIAADHVQHAGAHRLTLPVHHLSPGIYHLHLHSNGRTFVRKWVKG